MIKSLAAIRKRIAVLAALTALAATTLLAVGASPASATGHNIGTYYGDPTYCLTKTSYYMCLIYDASIRTRSAVWGTYSDDVNDLAGKTFSLGTGSNNGHGQPVKNDAGGMTCFENQCRSWVNENQSGNYDYEGGPYYGQLYFSWNNEASTSFT